MKLLELNLPYYDDRNKLIGAGVLPYAFNNGRLVFLLGQEDSDGRFGVFGGGIKAGASVRGTAAAEFFEETIGILGGSADMAQRLYERDYALKFAGAAGANRYFVTYMVRVPYDPQTPVRFARMRERVMHGDYDGCPGARDPETGRARYDFIEKRQIRWFWASDIMGHALRSRWNHPVTTMEGSPMFRRPFLAGLSGLVAYFNMQSFIRDLDWCDGEECRQYQTQTCTHERDSEREPMNVDTSSDTA